MNENTAPTAQPTEAAPAEYQNPNDLATEMTAEEEQAFINETLGLGAQEPEAPVEPAPEAAPVVPEPAAPEAPVVAPEAPVVEPEKPAELPTEPQTDDLWIEVEKTVVDAEGNAKTETVKLAYDPKNPASFVPDDFAFKNDKQLADILEAKAEMAALYKERKVEVDKALEDAEQVKTVEQQKQDQLAGWDAEIQDLIDSGVLAEPKVKPGDAKFLEDESVQKVDAVFKYMASQNEERSKEGKPAIRSFGTAFTMFENDAKIEAEEEAKQKENEDAKRRGALVGGGSSAATGTDRTYIAGSASNIWEVPTE